ncbi:MAG: response regulator transcription factor [Bacteroidetes bacterium]|nr:response regulator transcription factor [Bacteroidota bacterium]
MSDFIKVVIVEDEKDIRDMLMRLINDSKDVRCEHAFADCRSGVEGVLKHQPDVVLMDLGLPDESGIVGIGRIRDKFPEMDILVLSAQVDEESVFDALCAGACGYLVKQQSIENVVEAIYEAKNGGAPMSASIARRVIASFQRKPTKLISAREKEVLNELCKGKSYKLIADALFISEETVRRHLKNIYKKLEVSSKSEAVAKALKEKIV